LGPLAAFSAKVYYQARVDAERRLDSIGMLQMDPVGPKWYLSRAKRWHLPVLKRATVFRGSNATDEDLRLLASFRSLRTLVLMAGPFTDEGVTHLRRLKKLERLDLAGTQITDRSLQHIATLTTLKTLTLAGGGMNGWGRQDKPTDRTVALDPVGTALANVRLGPRWELLGARYFGPPLMPITDAGLRHLSSLKCLESLRLHTTTVTREGARDLKKALPQTTILLSGDQPGEHWSSESDKKR